MLLLIIIVLQIIQGSFVERYLTSHNWYLKSIFYFYSSVKDAGKKKEKGMFYIYEWPNEFDDLWPPAGRWIILKYTWLI